MNWGEVLSCQRSNWPISPRKAEMPHTIKMGLLWKISASLVKSKLISFRHSALSNWIWRFISFCRTEEQYHARYYIHIQRCLLSYSGVKLLWRRANGLRVPTIKTSLRRSKSRGRTAKQNSQSHTAKWQNATTGSGLEQIISRCVEL